MQELFAALPAILKQHDSIEVREAVAFAAWRKAAGAVLCEHVKPVSFEDGRLSLAVADRSWKRNLESLSGEMLFRINSLLGSSIVKFLEFNIDKNALDTTRGRDSNEVQYETDALDQINGTLRRAADLISDDALRRKFLIAAGSCLAREEHFRADE